MPGWLYGPGGGAPGTGQSESCAVQVMPPGPPAQAPLESAVSGPERPRVPTRRAGPLVTRSLFPSQQQTRCSAPPPATTARTGSASTRASSATARTIARTTATRRAARVPKVGAAGLAENGRPPTRGGTRGRVHLLLGRTVPSTVPLTREGARCVASRVGALRWPSRSSPVGAIELFLRSESLVCDHLLWRAWAWFTAPPATQPCGVIFLLHRRGTPGFTAVPFFPLFAHLAALER